MIELSGLYLIMIILFSLFMGFIIGLTFRQAIKDMFDGGDND